MITRTRWGSGLASTLALASLSLATRSALASPVFPGAIQQAAHMPCAPGCLLCHTVSPGTATTWTSKKLPQALFATHLLMAGSAASLDAAFAAFAGDQQNAAAVTALSQGVDPETGRSVCGPEYGCGVGVTRQPASNAAMPASMVLALGLFLSWLLRRGRTTPAR